ncbi:hypothetical protein [Streptomyces xanthochromogenes]|uniref:hypothetical protein n=1 Tax=Streptomyces xanthochromogenes TaxID=67384 RepID=UPI0034135378
MSTPAPARPFATVRDIRSSQPGSFATCYTAIHRHGFGGNPLCLQCRIRVETAGKKPAVS